MTRILSYNILFGGGERIQRIARVIRTVDPDIVAIVEALDEEKIRELAGCLHMHYCTNASPDGSWQTSSALLSRLPIVCSAVHARPGVITRPVLQVTLEEEHGAQLTAFVAHLIASFSHGRGIDRVRAREVREILRILRGQRTAHCLMGDFNALAPGDRLQASNLLRYIIAGDNDWQGDWQGRERVGLPSLKGVVPPQLHFLSPLLRQIPRSRLLCALFDEAGSLYAPRGSIGQLYAAGYVDCFRYVNPRAWGFTCPAGAPAGRIDYIFANPQLATRLSACKVVGGEEIERLDASDHLPVMAEFKAEIATALRPDTDDMLATSLGEVR
ncbi:MAG TPA: endonuclease/exonuclease/phosphatase family protein [Ktedonobacteraceae bacterium]|jgi:endonuclease/exonuclease/phosphatase family metal-dependent hydrolase